MTATEHPPRLTPPLRSRLAAIGFATAVCLLGSIGCGSEGVDSSEAAPGPGFSDAGGTGEPEADAGAGDRADTGFVPEEEEFLVREVAATDNFVFVPNSSDTSDTVARIDGRTLSVEPIQVADRPVAVRAAQSDIGGTTRDIAWVLCEGASAIAIIRSSNGNSPDVSLKSVPGEVNAIRLSPNGRHLLAYIDPDQPIDSGSGVSSLQTMAVVELGATADADAVHQLSVTPQISQIEFTADGDDAYIVGRDGINHLALDEIDGDTFVPPLDIGLSESAFPPTDRELKVSDDGDLLVLRSSAKAGLALYRPTGDGGDPAALASFDLPGRPTDLTLTDLPDGEGGTRQVILAPIRETDQVAIVDVRGAFDDTPSPTADASSPSSSLSYVDLISVDDIRPGLARLTPHRSSALLYTTLDVEPRLGILDIEQRSLRSFALRNQIRAVSVAPTGEAAAVIHEKQEGSPPTGASPAEFFRHNHGVTLVDLDSGYLRPVTLQGEPMDWLVTDNSDEVHSLYTILTADQSAAEHRGLLKLNLDSFRRDFYRTARQPSQLGRVADKVFVSQESEQGRITFVDVDSGETRTVSGYELNAGIR